MAIYYVDTAGTNSSGRDGSNTTTGRWATTAYAATRVTFPGDIIHVNAGSYTGIHVETARINLAVGVSLQGDGVSTTIIQSTYAGSSDRGSVSDGVLYLNSASGVSTGGNQSVSNITFDGNSKACYRALAVNFRNGVEINHCNFTNFFYSAVSFDGTTNGYPDFTSTYFSTGNKIHDCTILNCSTGNYGNLLGVQGHIVVGGQEGLEIYNNVLDNRGVAADYSGDTFAMGYTKGCKFYNNVLWRNNDLVEWNFFCEIFFTEGGFEVYGNTFNGLATFDIVDCRPGTYAFSFDIHDNIWTNPVQAASNGHVVWAIDFEDRGAIQGVNIYRNTFHNINRGVEFIADTSLPVHSLISGNVRVEDIAIYDNIFDGVGNTTNDPTRNSLCINIKPEGSTNVVWNNIYIDNNTMVSGVTNKMAYGVLIETGGTMSNIYVRNNIIQGAVGNPVLFSYNMASTITGSSFHMQKNLYYLNGTNAVGFSGVTISGIDYANVAAANPLFTSDFHLQPGSPAIGTGIHIPAITTDYAKLPFNAIPSIGAYEFGSVSVPVIPTLTTNSITNIAPTTATSGGNISSNGGATVTVSGVCWSTSANPVASGSHTTDGTGTGSFSSNITGLTLGITYHVRAYATNSAGTAYGNDVQFTTVAIDLTELITNGGFDTDTWWIKTNGTIISGGVAVINTAATYNEVLASPSIAIVAGVTYTVSFDIINYISGNILWCFGTPSTSSYSNGINHTANGHYVETGLVASVSGALPIITFVGWSSGAVMQIDNVSVKASGGGTAYLKTLADSVILSDLRTLATQFHLILNLIENSLVLTDGIVRQPVYSRVIADNVTLSDLNTKIVSTGRTDSVAMGDSPSFILNIIGGKTLADNITLSDAGIRTISKVLSDSIVLTDAAYPVDLAILDLLLSEVLTLSDSITGKQFQRIFADSVALTEAMNQGGGLTNTDSITLSDNMLGKQIQKVFADSITVIDNQINDQVKIVNALIQDIYTVIDDNIMLELTRVTDGGRTIWINNTIQQFLVDSVSLTDDPGKEVSKVLDDVSIINDEIVWPHDYAQSVSDHIALHETIAATLTRFRSRCALVNILRGGLAFLHFTNTPLVTSINLGSYSSVTMPSPQEIGNNAVLSGTGLPNEGTNLDLGELRSQK